MSTAAQFSFPGSPEHTRPAAQLVTERARHLHAELLATMLFAAVLTAQPDTVLMTVSRAGRAVRITAYTPGPIPLAALNDVGQHRAGRGPGVPRAGLVPALARRRRPYRTGPQDPGHWGVDRDDQRRPAHAGRRRAAAWPAHLRPRERYVVTAFGYALPEGAGG